MAVIDYYPDDTNNIDPDIIMSHDIPFIIGEVKTSAKNQVLFGSSTYYDDGDNGTKSVSYSIISSSPESAFSVDAAGDYELVFTKKTKPEIETMVNSMMDHMTAQSNMLKVQTPTIEITDAMLEAAHSGQSAGNIYQYTIDTTAYADDAVIYISFPAGSQAAKILAKGNGYTIKKKENQVYVMNVFGTDNSVDNPSDGPLLIEAMLAEIVTASGTVTMDTKGTNAKYAEKNRQLEKYITKKIIWNFPDATDIKLKETAGVFLAPKADVTCKSTSSGWVFAGKSFKNDECQWHFLLDLDAEKNTPVVPQSVKISKIATGVDGELPGATMKLYDTTSGTDIEIDSWTSGTTVHEAKTDKILIGHTYKIKEVTPPTNYNVANDITFAIGTDGKIKDVLAASSYDKTTGLIVMLDTAKSNTSPAPSTKPSTSPVPSTKPSTSPVPSTKPSTSPVPSTKPSTSPVPSTKPSTSPAPSSKPSTSPKPSATPSKKPGNTPKNLKISKQTTGGKELPGATMILYKGSVKEKNKVKEWVSGNAPYEISGSKLKIGTNYIIHEEVAPDGYKVATDITFTIGDDGKINNVKYAASSDAKKGLIVMVDKAKSSDKNKKEQSGTDGSDDKKTPDKSKDKKDQSSTGGSDDKKKDQSSTGSSDDKKNDQTTGSSTTATTDTGTLIAKSTDSQSKTGTTTGTDSTKKKSKSKSNQVATGDDFDLVGIWRTIFISSLIMILAIFARCWFKKEEE